jgi:hypothetical protein
MYSNLQGSVAEDPSWAGPLLPPAFELADLMAELAVRISPQLPNGTFNVFNDAIHQ